MPAETLTRPRDIPKLNLDLFPIQPTPTLETVEKQPVVRSLPVIEPGTRSKIYKVEEDTEFIPMRGGWGFYKFNDEKLIQDSYFEEPLTDIPQILVFPETKAQKGDYIAWSSLPDFGDVLINYKSAGLALKEVNPLSIKIPPILEYMLNDFKGIEDIMSSSDAVVHHDSKKRIPIFAYGNPLKQHAA